MKKYAIGVDIGGTKCAVVLGKGALSEELDPDFILDRVEFPTEPENGPQPALDQICQSIDRLLSGRRIGADALVGIGVSCGGPLDSEAGLILSPPNLSTWDRIPITRLLGSRYGTVCRLQNDANAGALAEWCFGAARGLKDVVFLTFGTGMGAGLILNRQLYCGANGMAGEVGHMRMAQNGPVGYGKIGSFEGFCSGGGLAQLARAAALEQLQQGLHPAFCPDYAALERLDARIVAQLAEQGDPDAQDIYAQCGSYLGRGLAVIVDVLNPEMIVIGSIFARSTGLIWPYASKELKKEALPANYAACRIVPSQLGDRLGDYSALSVALGDAAFYRRKAIG